MNSQDHYSLNRLRRGAWRFSLGKLASAMLTMVTFALTARLLGVQQYGIYAVAIAVIELTSGLCALGLDWVTGRYIPEFRQRADVTQFQAFIKRIFILQAGCLLIVAAFAMLMADHLANVGRLDDPRVVQISALVLLFEGCARVVRDQYLGLLLAQGSAQLATLSRAAVLLVLLMWLWLEPQAGGSSLTSVIAAEAAAGAVSLLVGGLALLRIVRRHRPDRGKSTDRQWVPPSSRELYELARNAYGGTLLVLAAGGPTITLVLRALAGTEAAAAFGFARGLVDQVRRVLPLDLFFGLIRAGVVSRYLSSRDFVGLNFQMGLIYALSVVAAMPVLAVMIGQPRLLASVVGGSTFLQAESTLAIWATSLLLFPHRRAVELVAYTVGRSGACVAGGAVLATGPIMVALMLRSGVPAALALSGTILAEIGFSVTVAMLLHRSGFLYRLAGATLWRLAAILVVSTASVAAIRVPVSGSSVTDLVVAGGLAVTLTWGLTLLVRPFTLAARVAIQRALPWPRFPF